MSMFRNLLIPNKSDDKNYILDNLVLWCDGIDNSSTGHTTSLGSVWKNLIGNVDLAFSNNPSWEITNNSMRLQVPSGVNFNNSGYKLTTNSTLPSTNSWTIEQYITIVSGGGTTNNSSAQIVVLQNTNSIPQNNIKFCNFLNRNEHIQFGGYAGDFYVTPTSYTNKTVLLTTIYTGTKFQIYIDGVMVNETTRNFSNNFNRYLTIGPYRNWTNQKLYDVYYHSIRYYTKALSLDEIQHNYNIDKERF